MYIYQPEKWQIKGKNNIKRLSKLLAAGTDAMQLGIDTSILRNSAGEIIHHFSKTCPPATLVLI